MLNADCQRIARLVITVAKPPARHTDLMALKVAIFMSHSYA